MVGLGVPEARVGNMVVVVEQVKDPRSHSPTAVSISQIPMQLVCSSMACKNFEADELTQRITIHQGEAHQPYYNTA
jgi:hypothetical protein